MTEETYNGWKNRETWAVALHLDNTQSAQEWLYSVARLSGENAEATDYWTLAQARLYTTEDAIREAVERAFSAFFAGDSDAGLDIGLCDQDLRMMIGDTGSLWRVDWREIARYTLEAIEQ